MSKRVDLAVPFEEKDDAKHFGVEWDEENRVWWTTEDQMCEELERWLPFTPTPDEVIQSLPRLKSTASEIEHVKLLSQTCEFREWMLLMLPAGLWGAFWRDDLDTNFASSVVIGDYDKGCRFISKKPSEVLDFMRENRLYTGPLRTSEHDWARDKNEPEIPSEAEDAPCCFGQLTIGGKTIEIQLPWVCEGLIRHLAENSPMPSMSSRLSAEIFEYLDRHTPASVKYPLIKQIAYSEEISQKLRVPLPWSARQNRVACQSFIDIHKADLTMYRSMHKDLHRGSWSLVKQINDYIKWSTARSMLSAGIPWETIAEHLGVKTKITIEKYATKADEAERESPELLSAPLYLDLIKLGTAGESVDLAVSRMIDDQVWEEFSHERLVRSLLKEAQTASET